MGNARILVSGTIIGNARVSVSSAYSIYSVVRFAGHYENLVTDTLSFARPPFFS
jgi:hypothetical protein